MHARVVDCKTKGQLLARMQVFCIVIMCIAGILFGCIIGEMQVRSLSAIALLLLTIVVRAIWDGALPLGNLLAVHPAVSLHAHNTLLHALFRFQKPPEGSLCTSCRPSARRGAHLSLSTIPSAPHRNSLLRFPPPSSLYRLIPFLSLSVNIYAMRRTSFPRIAQ